MPNKLIQVGQYIQEFNMLTGRSLPCGDIFQSVGLEIHIKKHHPKEVANISLIPEIISNPDYVGTHPREPDSIELVKVLSKNVMVCIKLDSRNGYLYVASVFEISNSKLANRVSSGRLKRFITSYRDSC